MILNKVKYIAFVALIALSACEKDIEIDVEEGVDKLVLNGWLQAGLVPEIRVDRSIFVFEQDQNTEITDAEVSLYENGELVSELLYDSENEIYTNADFVVAENGQYEVVVEHEDYGTVTSAVQIPLKLNAADVQLKYTNFLTEESPYQNYAGEIQIKIDDPAPQRNYYLIRVLMIEESWNPSINPDTTYRYVYSSNFSINDNQIETAYVHGGGELMLLSDELFNGGEYTISLSSYTDLRAAEYIEDSTSYYRTYHQIQFHQVNEAFYRYYISLENNRYPDVFTEPTQVYSNIENGYGILGASTWHVKEIDQGEGDNKQAD